MNRTIVIFNLIVALISIAKPIEETSAASLKTKDEYTNNAFARNSDGTNNSPFVFINNDDLLRSSDIIKVYNSEENVIAKTRNLKEQSENEQYEKVELKDESRTTKDSKPDDVTVTHEERVSTPAKEVEPKSATQEKSKTAEVATESSKLEGSATTINSKSKSSDYLENDKVEENANEKIATDEESKRSLEINNDESNSAWDVLDDILSRRMFSRPADFNVISKTTSSDKQVESTQVTIVPKPNFKPSKDQPYGSILTSTLVSRPHPVLPGQRFSLPALLTIRAAVPIDFRRILSQQSSKLINQDGQNEVNERTEISSELDSNAYPYTPPAAETHKVLPSANSILAKLAQASEHPQKASPYFGGDNSNIILGLPYYNMKPTYFIPTNYNAYKYITGYGRIF